MSGNTTSAGLHVGQTHLSTAAHSLLPIPSFLLGVFIGTLLMHPDAIHGLTNVSALVAAMLTIGVACSYFAWRDWFSILVLSSAMGIMNTSITRVGKQSVSLGFVTGDLNYLGQHLAMGFKRKPAGEMQGPWVTHGMRAALLAGIWTAFFVGAVLGGAAAARLASWTLCCRLCVGSFCSHGLRRRAHLHQTPSKC